jgi:hypothetical protein
MSLAYDPTTGEALLTEEARRWLSGELDTDEYLVRTRRLAADRAQDDVARELYGRFAGFGAISWRIQATWSKTVSWVKILLRIVLFGALIYLVTRLDGSTLLRVASGIAITAVVLVFIGLVAAVLVLRRPEVIEARSRAILDRIVSALKSLFSG